jgi:uncharacterized protein YbjT (DUF2867 family)
MIHACGSPDAPIPRLLESLSGRGHTVQSGLPAENGGEATLVVGLGAGCDSVVAGRRFNAWRSAPGARILVLSLLGVHPDARAQRLQELWFCEERMRRSGVPTLTLRLAPLVGPTSPFWVKLASRPRLPRGGRDLVQPVVEEDVVESIDRALHGNAPWEGWYEVAGPEIFSLRELAALAAAGGVCPGAAAWEPQLSEIREQRLAEPALWERDFAITPRNIRELAGSWAA